MTNTSHRRLCSLTNMTLYKSGYYYCYFFNFFIYIIIIIIIILILLYIIILLLFIIINISINRKKLNSLKRCVRTQKLEWLFVGEYNLLGRDQVQYCPN